MVIQKILASVVLCAAPALGPSLALAAQGNELNITAPIKSEMPNANAIGPSSELGTLTISAELKNEVRNIILNEKTEAESRSLEINSGVPVSNSVKLHPFPPAVVEIIPTHRSYQYFVVIDRRIVIVNPSTREIALVLLP